MPSAVVIIPCRYDSSRLPGKPLADIGGMTMIERVYRQASRAVDAVWVATDSPLIKAEVVRFGGQLVMTSPNHRNGTSRVAEAIDTIRPEADVIVNVQGDEPFISPADIQSLVNLFADPSVEIATTISPYDSSLGLDRLADPNLVKCVISPERDILWFSRAVIPYHRSNQPITYFTHSGIYAFRRDIFYKLASLSPSPLETAESLEQLRWLENGYRIKAFITDHPSLGIDTQADLEEARRIIASLQ